MSNNYSNLSDGMLYLQFEESAWRKRGEDERLSLLQELENRTAREEGRRPMTICRIPENEERAGLMGYYRDGTNSLFITGKFLRPQRLNLNDYNAAAAIDTVLHEGRHAFQHHVMREESTKTPQKNTLAWIMNTFSYFSYGQGDPEANAALYLYQPLELDARRFARQRMRRINNAIRSFSGSPDSSFTRYLQKDKMYERVYAAIALRTLTPEVMDRLDAEARRRFKEANPKVDIDLSRISIFSEARKLIENVDRLIDDPDAFGGDSRFDSFRSGDSLDSLARKLLDKSGVAPPKPDRPDAWSVRPTGRGRGF